MDVRSAGFAWLIEHAADTLNKGLVGPDGCTAYERVRGRRYGGLLYEFGQVILSQIPGKPEGGVIAPRWIKGIWLGKLWGTDEHIVTEPGGGVVRARSVKPHVEQWDRELFDGIVGWPNDPMARRKPGSDQPRVDIETPRPPVPSEAPPVQAAQVRRIMIRKEDVTIYGATEGCRRCRMLERGLDEGNREAGHSDECRTRMEAMIRGDPAQRQRLEAADRRRDEYLAREVEKGVDRGVEPEVAQEKPHEEESGRGEKRHAEGDEDQETAADEEEED